MCPAAAAFRTPRVVVVASSNPAKIVAARRAVELCWPNRSELQVFGASAPSGVPDQPFGDDQTLKGAVNRLDALCHQLHKHLQQQQQQPPCAPPLQDTEPWLLAASAAAAPSQSAAGGAPHPHPAAALLLSVEGGVVERTPGELACMAWAAARLAGPPAPAPPSSSPASSGTAAAGGGRVSTARSAEFLLPRRLSELVLRDGLELGAADDLVFARVNSGRGEGTIGWLTRGAITRGEYYTHALSLALIPFLNPALFPEYFE